MLKNCNDRVLKCVFRTAAGPDCSSGREKSAAKDQPYVRVRPGSCRAAAP